jgi:electron transport complex protein RnfB
MQVQDDSPSSHKPPPRSAATAGTGALHARVLAIDALLPQTQCGQCGYAGCLPYAQALAEGSAPINRCPPGGDAGVAALAGLLWLPVLELDPACGVHRPLHVAVIDENRCVGCTLCIQACPVDAIIGAVKRMHTVLPGDCTGCDLCLPPCPMDCIAMVPVDPPRAWTRADADHARRRLHERVARLQRESAQNDLRLTAKALHKLEQLNLNEAQHPGALPAVELARRKAIIEQALARVRQRRATPPDAPPQAAAPNRSGT